MEERNGKILAEMQHWDFNKKVSVAQTRIIEYYNRLDGKCFISFSGGKDSTVLLDIVRKIFPEIEAVYCDTGLEYPEVRDHVKSVDNVTWLKPKMNFKRVVTEIGYPIVSKDVAEKVYYYYKHMDDGTLNEDTWAYKMCHGIAQKSEGGSSRYNLSEKWIRLLVDQRPPFKISHLCCKNFKKDPMDEYAKDTGKFPISGTMASESRARSMSWINYGCNSFGGKTFSKPLSIWTDQDILEYIVRYNLKIPSVYGDIVRDENGKYKTTGCRRTGCMFCAFGCHLDGNPNRFQTMRISHPKLWHYCMKPVSDGGLGMKEVLDYCGIATGYEDQYQTSLLESNEFIEI